MHSDPISEMLSRIRNACLRGHPFTLVPHSKLKENIIKVLLAEGFVSDYEVKANRSLKNLKISLKYLKDGSPLIRSISRISKPGRRVFVGVNKITPVLNSQGIKVVSTPSGIKSDNECREQNLGGELICEIY